LREIPDAVAVGVRWNRWVISTRQTPSYGGDWGFGSTVPWQLRLGQVMVGLEAWAIPLLWVALALGMIGGDPDLPLAHALYGPSVLPGAAPFVGPLVLTAVAAFAAITVWFAVAINLQHRPAAFWLAVALQAGLLAAALRLASPALALVSVVTVGLLLVPTSRRAALGHTLPAA
jgi:hypothetical protein